MFIRFRASGLKFKVLGGVYGTYRRNAESNGNQPRNMFFVFMRI